MTTPTGSRPTAPTPVPDTPQSCLSGTAVLARLVLRRDRVLLPVWVLLSVGIVATTAAGALEAFPTEADRHAWATGLAGNPMELALVGPIYGTRSRTSPRSRWNRGWKS